MNTDVIAAFIATLIASFGIPSAITGFCFWRIKRSIDTKEKKNEEIENARAKNEYMLVRSVSAAIALGEATARAVQRIPDAHCNGDMHEALEYAQRVKHEQKDFLTQQGVERMY